MSLILGYLRATFVVTVSKLYRTTNLFSTGPRSSQSSNFHKPEDLQQTKTSLAEDEKTLSVFDGSMLQRKKL